MSSLVSGVADRFRINGSFRLKCAWVFVFFILVSCGPASQIPPAATQQTSNSNADLEKVLWGVNQQWLCSGPYVKPYKDCVEFRSKYWADQFFEVIPTGELLNKEEMVATQTAAIPSNPAPGTGPYPDAFKLRAVYGDFAMATDHTNFKTADKSGKLVFTSNAKVLRLFVKENGSWRPAAAGLVPIILPTGPVRPSRHSTTPRKSPDEQLEKELAEVDRAWMDSSDLNKRLDYIKNLFTDQWFEILDWDPIRDTSKSMVLEVLPKLAATGKPGEGVVQDQFQLQAVFGDVALASDRRTRTRTNEKGQLVKTPHRSLLVFVKQNREWRSAGASLTPIMTQ